jgi:hypothetical protein
MCFSLRGVVRAIIIREKTTEAGNQGRQVVDINKP